MALEVQDRHRGRSGGADAGTGWDPVRVRSDLGSGLSESLCMGANRRTRPHEHCRFECCPDHMFEFPAADP
jgi:hypothetical protein